MSLTSQRAVDVAYWHMSDVAGRPLYVRYRGCFGRDLLAASITVFDPQRTSGLLARLDSPGTISSSERSADDIGTRADHLAGCVVVLFGR